MKRPRPQCNCADTMLHKVVSARPPSRQHAPKRRPESSKNINYFAKVFVARQEVREEIARGGGGGGRRYSGVFLIVCFGTSEATANGVINVVHTNEEGEREKLLINWSELKSVRFVFVLFRNSITVRR